MTSQRTSDSRATWHRRRPPEWIAGIVRHACPGEEWCIDGQAFISDGGQTAH
jgi:hypothetical protein